MDLKEQNKITNKINDEILKYKEQGWSTKGVSDKWHTFSELYYHRMILFLTIQKSFKEVSWKSKQHHDGTMFDDSFITGIDTPEGQYTYHYDLEYWDLFKDIKTLDKAPEYDGHKPKDIGRLLSLFWKDEIKTFKLILNINGEDVPFVVTNAYDKNEALVKALASDKMELHEKVYGIGDIINVISIEEI